MKLKIKFRWFTTGTKKCLQFFSGFQASIQLFFFQDSKQVYKLSELITQEISNGIAINPANLTPKEKEEQNLANKVFTAYNNFCEICKGKLNSDIIAHIVEMDFNLNEAQIFWNSKETRNTTLLNQTKATINAMGVVPKPDKEDFDAERMEFLDTMFDELRAETAKKLRGVTKHSEEYNRIISEQNEILKSRTLKAETHFLRAYNVARVNYRRHAHQLATQNMALATYTQNAQQLLIGLAYLVTCSTSLTSFYNLVVVRAARANTEIHAVMCRPVVIYHNITDTILNPFEKRSVAGIMRNLEEQYRFKTMNVLKKHLEDLYSISKQRLPLEQRIAMYSEQQRSWSDHKLAKYLTHANITAIEFINSCEDPRERSDLTAKMSHYMTYREDKYRYGIPHEGFIPPSSKEDLFQYLVRCARSMVSNTEFHETGRQSSNKSNQSVNASRSNTGGQNKGSRKSSSGLDSALIAGVTEGNAKVAARRASQIDGKVTYPPSTEAMKKHNSTTYFIVNPETNLYSSLKVSGKHTLTLPTQLNEGVTTWIDNPNPDDNKVFSYSATPSRSNTGTVVDKLHCSYCGLWGHTERRCLHVKKA